MQPYVIRQGDYLAKLAHRFGFDADAVWNDPSNADLRELRPNPDILWPTDVLSIPEDSDNPPPQHELVLGTTNTFTSYVPTIPVSLRFTDEGLRSQAYTILELPELTDRATDGDGTAFFDVSVMQRRLGSERGVEEASACGHIEGLIGPAESCMQAGIVVRRWSSVYHWRSGTSSDFKLRSIGRDGRRQVIRTIPELVMFDVDEQRVAWMDRSEGPCDEDVTPHKGVVWVAPLSGGPAQRIVGRQTCAVAMWLAGDDVSWITESAALWWASVRTGQHLVVSCGRSRVRGLVQSDRWVYLLQEGIPKNTRQIVRVPWWR